MAVVRSDKLGPIPEGYTFSGQVWGQAGAETAQLLAQARIRSLTHAAGALTDSLGRFSFSYLYKTRLL